MGSRGGGVPVHPRGAAPAARGHRGPMGRTRGGGLDLGVRCSARPWQCAPEPWTPSPAPTRRPPLPKTGLRGVGGSRSSARSWVPPRPPGARRLRAALLHPVSIAAGGRPVPASCSLASLFTNVSPLSFAYIKITGWPEPAFRHPPRTASRRANEPTRVWPLPAALPW